MGFIKAHSLFFWPAFVCGFAWNTGVSFYDLIISMSTLLSIYVAHIFA